MPAPRVVLAGYLVRWTYTLDGAEVTGVSFADLVSHAASQVVTPNDVDKRFPGFIAENQGADFIAEAFRAVRLEAVGDVHAQRRISDTHVLRELVNTRANVIRLEQEVMYGAPRAAELAIAEQRYRSCYARLVDLQKPTSYVRSYDDEPAKPLAKGSEPGVRRRLDDPVNINIAWYRNQLVTRANGKEINSLGELIQAIESTRAPFHVLELGEPGRFIVLDRKASDEASPRILERYGVKKDRNP